MLNKGRSGGGRGLSGQAAGGLRTRMPSGCGASNSGGALLQARPLPPVCPPQNGLSPPAHDDKDNRPHGGDPAEGGRRPGADLGKLLQDEVAVEQACGTRQAQRTQLASATDRQLRAAGMQGCCTLLCCCCRRCRRCPAERPPLVTSPVNRPKTTAMAPRPASSGEATKAAVMTWCIVYCGRGVGEGGGSRQACGAGRRQRGRTGHALRASSESHRAGCLAAPPSHRAAAPRGPAPKQHPGAALHLP